MSIYKVPNLIISLKRKAYREGGGWQSAMNQIIHTHMHPYPSLTHASNNYHKHTRSHKEHTQNPSGREGYWGVKRCVFKADLKTGVWNDKVSSEESSRGQKRDRRISVVQKISDRMRECEGDRNQRKSEAVEKECINFRRSDRYDRSSLFTDLKARRSSLYWILCSTGRQWRVRRTEYMWSNLRVRHMSLATLILKFLNCEWAAWDSQQVESCSNQFCTGQKQRSVSWEHLVTGSDGWNWFYAIQNDDLTGAGDLLLKRRILVESDAQAADNWGGINRGSIQIDRERDDRLFWLCLEVMRFISLLSGFGWSLLLCIHAWTSVMRECEALMISWRWERFAEM